MSTARMQLVVISVIQVLVMSCWFGMTTMTSSVTSYFDVSLSFSAWFSIAVQLGFVAGGLVSAFFNLADRINAAKLIGLSSFLVAFSNVLLLLAPNSLTVIILRFITGFGLAGVYPPGMRIIASWYINARGKSVGVLIAALTLGSALPHFIGQIMQFEDWKLMIVSTSLLAGIGGVFGITIVQTGRHVTKPSRLNLKLARELLSNKTFRLLTLGYCGHMWELYAGWTWLASFLVFTRAGLPDQTASSFTDLIIFSTIGIAGALGAVLGGKFGDHFGHPKACVVFMSLSGLSCLALSSFASMYEVVLFILLFIWGFSVIADSGLFSTSIMNHVPPDQVGTALTLQTTLGFFISTLSIQLAPLLAGMTSWKYLMFLLALGPLFGVLAILKFLSTQSNEEEKSWRTTK